MKRLLRPFLFSTFSLWLSSKLIGGLRIQDSIETYVLGGATLAFICIFIRPILKLLFLPINLISLGLLSWLVNVAVLYLLTMVVPQIKVVAWRFEGFSNKGFVIPVYDFNQIATFIVVSFVLSFIMNFLAWLCR